MDGLLMRVRNKRENYALLKAGRFGSRLRHWANEAELAADPYGGKVGIRSWRVGFRTIFGLPQAEVAARLDALEAEGQPREWFYLSEMAPDEHIVLQGEFFDGSSCGAFANRHLTYSTVQAPMKPALAAETRYAEGAASEAILRSAMFPASWDDFVAIRESYPDAAIEFSCYSICLGDRPHRNTLFWEVRTDY